jgi:hypothetical protein
VACPVCGHVVVSADGVSRQDAALLRSGVRQPVPLPPSGRNRCGPFCRRFDGHGRWSFCRWTPTAPLAALRTAGVRDPCRIAGRCPDPCRTTASCNGGAAADASAVVSGDRTG